jgi:uncharacterized membrane protein YphA (DoxX/SURF4 family)
MRMSKQSGKLMYWGATILVAFIFVASGLMKIFGGDATAEMARGLGGENNLIILGVLELVIALVWVLPRTGVAGTLLAVAYIGGALAVHFVTGQPVFVPVAIQVVIWLAAAIRFPELTQRLFKRELTQSA